MRLRRIRRRRLSEAIFHAKRMRRAAVFIGGLLYTCQAAISTLYFVVVCPLGMGANRVKVRNGFPHSLKVAGKVYYGRGA